MSSFSRAMMIAALLLVALLAVASFWSTPAVAQDSVSSLTDAELVAAVEKLLQSSNETADLAVPSAEDIRATLSELHQIAEAGTYDEEANTTETASSNDGEEETTSGSSLLAVPSTLNTAAWQGSIYSSISSRTIASLTFPGSHDAGAYSLSSTLSPRPTDDATLNSILSISSSLGITLSTLTIPWGLAQSTSIYNQLLNGARYFDIRAAFDGTIWRSYHFNLGVPIQDHLNDLRNFLNAYPNEVVVVEISHFQRASSSVQSPDTVLRDQIVNTLGSLLAPRSLGLTATYGSLVSTNRRALVFFENSTLVASTASLWYTSTLVNSYANSDSLSTLQSYNLGIINSFNAQSSTTQLFKLSWTLTPQSSTIIRGLLLPPRSLRQLAANANPNLYSWAQTNVFARSYRFPQILLADYFETANAVRVAILSI